MSAEFPRPSRYFAHRALPKRYAGRGGCGLTQPRLARIAEDTSRPTLTGDISEARINAIYRAELARLKRDGVYRLETPSPQSALSWVVAST